MGKVVEGEITGVTGASGAKVGFEIERIITTHDLETKLGIDAKASYAASAFANIAGRFEFAAASKIHTTSLCMAITSTVSLAVHSIDNPVLTPAAAALVDNPTAFATRFGDMFVRGIGRGGIFIAVLKIDTSDDQESEDISSQLSGAYGLFSGEAKQKFESIQRDFKSELSISVYHEGGPVNLIPGKIDDPIQLFTLLQTWLNSFVEQPDQMAVPYYAVLAPIVIANGPLPPNQAEADHAQDVLAICAKQRSACLDGMNLMDAIITSPKRFSLPAPTTMADIRAASSGYQADLDVIASAASAAMNHPASAKMPADFAAAANQRFPQGIQPTPMAELDKGLSDALADKGRRVALSDPLLAAMRELEPEGPNRLGFETGIAIAADQTLWGPGKQGLIDNLPVAEQQSAGKAAHFAVTRNANATFALKGAQIAVADTRPEVVSARALEAPGYYTLGFDIATALFGNTSIGGMGHTAQGPGSGAIRAGLPPEGIRGFDASVKLHMGK
jgi:hypothetical protein